MNFSIYPNNDGNCTVTVDGKTVIVPCVSTIIERLNGKINISFEKDSSDKIIELLKESKSTMIDQTKI